MKKLTVVSLFFLLCCCTFAQKQFIKSVSATDYGFQIRVLPALDSGWVVFSSDSTKLTKFDQCGESLWSNKYNIPNVAIGLSDFIRTADGGFALVTRMQKNSIYISLLTRLDAAGNILWCKSFGDNIYNQFPYTLNEDNQGNLVLFANVEHETLNDVFNMVCKVSSNGNLLSTHFYNHGGIWGGAIVTNDNGVLFRTGSTLIKTDASGNPQWTSIVSASTYNYFTPVEVSDGYIFTGYNNGTNYITFYKLNKQGNLLWGGRKTTDFIGVPPQLRKKANGNFAAVFQKTFSGQNHSTTIEFDKDLNIISQNSLNDVLLTARDICFPGSNGAVLAGIKGSQPFFAKTDNGYNSGCNIAIPPMTITLEPASAAFGSTTVTNYTLNTWNENFTANTISVSTTTLCSPIKALELGNDTLLCTGTSFVLKNKSPHTFDHYLWSTSATTPTIAVTQPGTYTLTVYDDCVQDTLRDTIHISLKPGIMADLGADVVICENESHILQAPQCDSCTFLWSTGSVTDTIEIHGEGTYWLTLFNNNGCVSQDTVEAMMDKCECSIFLPSAFTPNSDGRNEIFAPVYYCDLKEYTLQVYSRWGDLIFESTKPDAGWDGRIKDELAIQGIYLYRLVYAPLVKGKAYEYFIKSGSVAVIY